MPSLYGVSYKSNSEDKLTPGRSKSVYTPDQAPNLPPHYPRSRWHTDARWECRILGSVAPKPSYRPVAAHELKKKKDRTERTTRNVMKVSAGITQSWTTLNAFETFSVLLWIACQRCWNDFKSKVSNMSDTKLGQPQSSLRRLQLDL